MKRCTQCGEEKPRSEFYARASAKDGRRSSCRVCDLDHARTPAGKAARHKYKRTPKGEGATRKYKRGPAGKAATRRYEAGENGRAASRRKAARSRAKWPEKVKARMAVRHAITANRLPPATMFTCECGDPAEEYHHFAGYDEANWFFVNAVCRPCHFVEHTP